MIPSINIRVAELQTIWPAVERAQELAEKYDIKDIFQDAGGKMLQIAIRTGVDLNPARQGADAFDRMGNEYEIKSTDSSRTKQGFSTSHHLNLNTMEGYRDRRWIFAVYDGITLVECYLMEGVQLEPIFAGWAKSLRQTGKSHINNPKIPLAFVRKHAIPFA